LGLLLGDGFWGFDGDWVCLVLWISCLDRGCRAVMNGGVGSAAVRLYVFVVCYFEELVGWDWFEDWFEGWFC
jgi:hypothetical protein